ncbi:MAG: hypothetical protein R3344_13605, partial [Acidobacteriota bacterium]|nr:hypothetical protein [Acidobacteriota bacterium]
YEPAHPNRDGIFTTIERSESRDGRGLKTLWKSGYRTLRWSASDPNEDELEYRLDFRRDEDGSGWIPIPDEIDEERYSFDATVLPDGAYRFRLTASDAPANAAGTELTASRVSDVVVIDHSPPRLAAATVDGDRLRVTVTDDLNILREAVVSVDAGKWKPVAGAGLLDSRSETLDIPLAPGARLLLLRLTDASHNVITYDLSEHLR